MVVTVGRVLNAGIKWVETRNAAKHPQCTGWSHKNYLAQNVNSAKVKKKEKNLLYSLVSEIHYLMV